MDREPRQATNSLSMRKLWSHPSEKLPQPPNRDDVYSTFDKAIPTTVVDSIILLLWFRSFDICGGRLNTLPDRFVQSVVSTISFFFFSARQYRSTISSCVRLFLRVANHHVHFAQTR